MKCSDDSIFSSFESFCRLSMLRYRSDKFPNFISSTSVGVLLRKQATSRYHGLDFVFIPWQSLSEINNESLSARKNIFILFVSIFFRPHRELRCLRNTIHCNLFFTYIFSALLWLMTLSFQVSASLHQREVPSR